ncbi:MAG TPA: antitoxin VapB family protein [Candidatus Nanoarchaeia archaeon]|nr:antitoxin VapB family protein [Candidatus Nanoarchaeia archaeon]
MAVKTLTITEDAYNKIRYLKHGDESFSELFTRIAEEKMNVAGRFFGMADLSHKEAMEWRESLRKYKREFTASFEKKQRKIKRG